MWRMRWISSSRKEAIHAKNLKLNEPWPQQPRRSSASRLGQVSRMLKIPEDVTVKNARKKNSLRTISTIDSHNDPVFNVIVGIDYPTLVYRFGGKIIFPFGVELPVVATVMGIVIPFSSSRVFDEVECDIPTRAASSNDNAPADERFACTRADCISPLHLLLLFVCVRRNHLYTDMGCSLAATSTKIILGCH